MKINQGQVPWTDEESPKKKFGILRKALTLAVGGKKDIGVFGGGHPFDVELTKLPPGKANWPLHEHTAQWEAFIVVSGRGILRTKEAQQEIVPGDFIVNPPGEAHQIINSGQEDLVYYVIADNPPSDIIYYPDSKKWAMKPPRKVYELREVDYYKDEE